MNNLPSFERDELIAEALTCLVRKELSLAMRAAVPHQDPMRVRHHMERATRALELRMTFNG